MSSHSHFYADLLGLGMIAGVSLGIGLAANSFRAKPLPLLYMPPKARLGASVARLSTDSPAPVHWQTVSLDEFQEWVSSRRGISIDARARPFYEQGHVPGAFNLPREGFEPAYARLRASLETARSEPVVVYCSESDCRDSELVADALSRLGFRQLFVYKEGWEEWQRAGLPQETDRPQ